MERKSHIETETEKIDLYYEKEGDDYPCIDEDIEAAAKALGCSPKLLQVLLAFRDDIKEQVSTDLKQIYGGLEKVQEILKETGLCPPNPQRRIPEGDRS